ncbi:hypothetical protein GCM10027566_38640 [Arachidicoccus ginsenosidivorans]
MEEIINSLEHTKRVIKETLRILTHRYDYIVIILRDGNTVTITCLMDIFLKKKIENWSGIELEHKAVLFPFLKKNST